MVNNHWLCIKIIIAYAKLKSMDTFTQTLLPPLVSSCVAVDCLAVKAPFSCWVSCDTVDSCGSNIAGAASFTSVQTDWGNSHLWTCRTWGSRACWGLKQHRYLHIWKRNIRGIDNNGLLGSFQSMIWSDSNEDLVTCVAKKVVLEPDRKRLPVVP